MPIVHCNLILALINSCLVLSYSCITDVSEYVLTFLLSSQTPEVRAPAFISHLQLVILFISMLCHPYCSSWH